MSGPNYDPERLREAINKIEDNIKVFEKAIDDERDRIKEYQEMINVIERKKMEQDMAEKMKAELEKQMNKD